MHYRQVSICCALLGVIAVTPAMAERTISGSEIKALITGKTVHAKRAGDGAELRIYFASDGQGYEDGGPAKGKWEVNAKGEHCADWAKLKCARVIEVGDGRYARLKPDGNVAVYWTKIVEGKDL